MGIKGTKKFEFEDTQEGLGFDDMMSKVDDEVASNDAAEEILENAPVLVKLNDNIDKATDTLCKAILSLEDATQECKKAELKLCTAVGTISGKVDTINTHIDKVLEQAPTKLTVEVHASDADMKAIKDLFDEKAKETNKHITAEYQNLNNMLIEERKRTREMFKDYDGMWLGHYGQWFFMFFFIIGLIVVGVTIVVPLIQKLGWLK